MVVTRLNGLYGERGERGQFLHYGERYGERGQFLHYDMIGVYLAYGMMLDDSISRPTRHVTGYNQSTRGDQIWRLH